MTLTETRTDPPGTLTSPTAKTETSPTTIDEIVGNLVKDRIAAHAFFFPHRHKARTPEFHYDIIRLWHSPVPRVVTEAFRDAAKSTIMEEVFILKACFREFRNGIIVGPSYDRALERLAAIKHEFEQNEAIHEIFGFLKGAVWTENRIELSNGVVIRSYGAGQSLRGSKHLDARPDFCLIDDLEDEDTVLTPDSRQKTLRWLYRTLIPALAKDAKIRFIGNRLDPEAVIVQVANDQEWVSQRFPIMYLDEPGIESPVLPAGKWMASWPAMFPIEWIIKTRSEYQRRGLLSDFNCEYMCEAETPEEKPFKAEMIRIVPRLRVWEATWAMYDPARTVHAKSATTGKAVWSWIGNRLVVWDGFAKQLLPDEIIADLFKTDDEFRPVMIGVEETGLSEWINQPLRHEQAKRGHLLPVKAVNAPKGKLDFIRGLEPFFKAGEVEFACDIPELRHQLISFPTGKIDFPNALAYALRMRPGSPIYDEFSSQNVVPEILKDARHKIYLAIGATGSYVTGVLLQYIDGLRIIADWIEEGPPDQSVQRLLQTANLEAMRQVVPMGAPVHFDKWHNVGLRQAMVRIPVELQLGGNLERGRVELRNLFRRQTRGIPAITISHEARWSLNGFAGGYARAVKKGGVLGDEAEPGIYRTLIESIESFCAMLQFRTEEDDESLNYRYSESGRKYLSAMARR